MQRSSESSSLFASRTQSLQAKKLETQISFRQDLSFSPASLFSAAELAEIVKPKSAASLEKYLPWKSLVREANQPKPRISLKTLENFEQKRQKANDLTQELLESYFAQEENIKEKLNKLCIEQEKNSNKKEPLSSMLYWQNSIFAHRLIEQALKGKTALDFDSFLQWFKDLHKISCSGLDGNNHYYKEILESNQKLKEQEAWTAFRFLTILHGYESPPEGIFCRYENQPEREKLYFNCLYLRFAEIVESMEQAKPRDETLKKLSDFYAQASALPPFERINNSLFMNIVNTVLNKMKLNRISHDYLDNVHYKRNHNLREKVALLSPQQLNQFFIKHFLPAVRGQNVILWLDFFKSL